MVWVAVLGSDDDGRVKGCDGSFKGGSPLALRVSFGTLSCSADAHSRLWTASECLIVLSVDSTQSSVRACVVSHC